MGAIRKTPTGNWELTLRNKRLLGDGVRLFFTYDTEADAREDERVIESALASGQVPRKVEAKLAALAAGTSRQTPKGHGRETLAVVIRAWIENGAVAPTDEYVLNMLRGEVGDKTLGQIDYAWAEGWIDHMKRVKNYAPGTIRKRIGSLSRCLDWWLRRKPESAPHGNPLKLLPKGAAAYSQKDAREIAASGGRVKKDVVRDRRLVPGELERIDAALRGEKREDRERPLSNKDGDAFSMLFWLILNTGMRLREAYLLERKWVDLPRAVVRLRCSKQWYGREKWRDVPIRPDLMPRLRDYLNNTDSSVVLLFPFAKDLSEAGLSATTNRLSRRFASLFNYADCPGMTEHDLRHEATCRWYELRDANGGWLFRESEIMTIMGWEPGSPMPARYASFRAEDLAQRMYVTISR